MGSTAQKCGYENPTSSKYCGRCGSPLNERSGSE
ncbi:MAG: zinc-ribbon domain-containing protein [Euryarchaeota archaeon]|nr:zinc-ribbon domain-containing protein [Euryarchaeota archaeon]MBU4139731.1 zinc-ribbon domain-containing protein [Euryarchaeota archaeon]